MNSSVSKTAEYYYTAAFFHVAYCAADDVC